MELGPFSKASNISLTFPLRADKTTVTYGDSHLTKGTASRWHTRSRKAVEVISETYDPGVSTAGVESVASEVEQGTAVHEGMLVTGICGDYGLVSVRFPSICHFLTLLYW